MPKYDAEKKAMAVARMAEIGVQKTSEELNISAQTLYKWRNEEKGGIAAILADVGRDDLRQLIANDKILEEKVSRLEGDNESLRDENKALRDKYAQLKKAVIALIG
jgi:transposase-like protein